MHFLDKYPFLVKYFENGIKNPNKSIAHSILLYGHDLQAQYDLALYIARLLNCKKDQNYDCNCLDCNCLDCNWIRMGEHPAVLTISRVDNKSDGDDSKTVISIKQAQEIKQSLLTSSDFHRVFIFCDRDNDDNIQGLNKLNFHEEAANALLKTIEEPPAKTTFFFLTRSKEDILSTIISRSQCFFVPSFEATDYKWDSIKTIFENYYEFSRGEVFDLAKELNDVSPNAIKTLNEIQNYMLSLLKSNLDNKQIQFKLMHDIEAVELAKNEVTANVLPLNAFENLCLDIIK